MLASLGRCLYSRLALATDRRPKDEGMSTVIQTGSRAPNAAPAPQLAVSITLSPLGVQRAHQQVTSCGVPSWAADAGRRAVHELGEALDRLAET